MATIERMGVPLHYWTLGNSSNPLLLFSNGGPGDDHTYLRSVAENYADQFYCVLYDQRGCGQSTVTTYDESTLHINEFMADMDALRQHFQREQIALWGHSWGATLSLLYGVHYSEHVQRMVLVGMGPMTREGGEIADANLAKPLSFAEREQLEQLRNRRKQAFAMQDWEALAQIHIEIVTQYYVKAWFYSREAAVRFAEDFMAHYSYNPRVGPLVLPTVKALDLLALLRDKAFPLQVVYGYQDFEPITQAYLIKECLETADLCFINRAGHVPWYEQAEMFYPQTRAFLLAT